MSGKLVHYVSFLCPARLIANPGNSAYSCIVKPHEKDALAVFEIYCNHLHSIGWRKIKSNACDEMNHHKMTTFSKNNVIQYVVMDIIEE